MHKKCVCVCVLVCVRAHEFVCVCVYGTLEFAFISLLYSSMRTHILEYEDKKEYADTYIGV
jgi:hypothetical protein